MEQERQKENEKSAWQRFEEQAREQAQKAREQAREQREQAQKLQEATKAEIIRVLQEQGMTVEPEDECFHALDNEDLLSLGRELMDAVKIGNARGFWENARHARKKAKVDPERAKVASAALAAAFKAPYVDSQNALMMLLKKLDGEQKGVSMSTTPCASVIQSSGTGKSRSLVELASLDVYVCYCSLQTKSGFPLRTSKLADALIKERQEEAYYRGYLKAWLEILHMYLSGELNFASQPSSPSSSSPLSPCRQWMLEHILMEEEQVSAVINAVNEQWEQNGSCTYQEVQTALQKVCPRLSRQEGVGILFVFDEAAQLFSDGAGNNIRRAFLSVLQSTFGVFVDTCSNVSVLAPSLERDSSQRVRAGTLTIPSPVWEISNVNALADDLKRFKKLGDLTLQRLFKYGRPLWASCMSSIADKVKEMSQGKEDGQAWAMAEARALATRKLCGGVQEGVLATIRAGGALLDPTTALAILGARLVIDVNPLSRLATNLVASHMSYVLDISDGNRCITSCEPWDPIITHAAKDIFYHKGFRIAALGHLQSCMEQHWVDEGKTGELVGRYILVRAMDTVKKQQQSVNLGDFLCALVGDKQSVTREGLVNFSGFVPSIGYTPGLEDLLKAFILEKAFICRTNQARFDALIPVLLPAGKGRSFLLKQENMSILGIQFKNINRDCDMSFEASIWMSPEGAEIGGWRKEQPFVTVLMQLGMSGSGHVQFVKNNKPEIRSAIKKADQPTTSLIQHEAQVLGMKQLSFVVYGLEDVYDFLEEEERKLLQELIQCRRHRLMDPTVEEFAQTLMPLSFKRKLRSSKQNLRSSKRNLKSSKRRHD